MFEATASALDQLLESGPLLAFFLVIPYALLGGLLPGTSLPLTVILLGFVGRIDPLVALVLVTTKDAAGDITEPVPSILMGIPGSRAAQATILDGYPLARQGKAAWALGASYTTTLVGGMIGAIILYAFLPVGREILTWFGSAEFFLLGFMGVAAVAVVSSGAVVKGLLTASFGLAIALIGFSPIGGVIRSDFGISYLFNGFPLVPVIVGLFALPEAIGLVVSNKAIAREHADDVLRGRNAQAQAFDGMREAFKHKLLMIRSSIIGVMVGIMPGVGAGAAHWIAYASARQTEKGATKTFGTGDIRGVIAADAPNNSIDGAELIPTLAFGIPGSSGKAVFLTLLILLGYTPGPSMLEEHLDITIALVFVIAASNIVVVPIMFLFAGTIAKFTTLRPQVIAPFVIGVTLLAAFQATNQMTDLIVVGVFAGLGLFMKAYGWPRTPLLIALVLVGIVEKYLWISTNALGWSMLARPQFLIIAAAGVAMVAWTMTAQRKAEQEAGYMRVDEAGRAGIRGDEPSEG